MNSWKTSCAIWVVCAAAMAAGCSNPEEAKRRYFESGSAFAAREQYAEAVVDFRNALRQDPQFGEARMALAEVFEKSNNPSGALREYVRAADLLPENVAAQIKAAMFLLGSRQFEDARTRAERALALDPTNVEALILRANAMGGMDDIDGAIRQIEEAIRAGTDDGRMYLSLGALRSVGGQDAEAEAAFQNAMRLNPKSVEARLSIAHFYWTNGQRPEVEQALTEALAIDPSHLMANRMAAAFYMATGRPERAEVPLKVIARVSEEPAAALALADYYIGVKRSRDAETILERLVGHETADLDARLRLASIARGSGRKDAAIRILDEVIGANPRVAAPLALKSAWQLEDGDAPGALSSAAAAAKVEPASVPAQLALGRAQVAVNDWPAAITTFNEVLRLNPRVGYAQLMLSRLQLRAGDPEEAVKLARDAARALPQSPDPAIALARSLLASGDARAAEPLVRDLVQAFPDRPAVHSAQGILFIAQGNGRGARAAFERALDRDPDFQEALEGLLAVDVAEKTVAAAVARIDTRLADRPDDPRLLLVAARSYAAAGDFERAERALRDVIRIDPNNLGAYLQLAQNYVARGRLQEAVAEFDAVVARQPGHVGAATMAAMLLQVQNRNEDAQRRYEAIVAAHPRAAIASNNLAWLIADGGGNLDRALQLAQTAKAQLPDMPEINDTLGWIYYMKELPRQALPYLEQSVAAATNNAAYRVRLGMAYAAAGEREKAIETLRRALDLNPPAEQAAEARRVLRQLNG